MITGIIQSKSSQLPKISEKAPHLIKLDSLTKRFERWTRNAKVDAKLFFLPFITRLLTILYLPTAYIILDGSVVGRGCVTLMAILIYQKRAIPLVWITQRGKKGHFKEKTHLALLKQVKAILPVGMDVVVLGDGEFDGINFLEKIYSYGWDYVVRTAKNAKIILPGEGLTSFSNYVPVKGKAVFLKDAAFTEAGYDVELAIVWWRKDRATPIYLISSLENAMEVLSHYKKRFLVETFFSDKKSRGFNLHKSHIAKIKHLNALMVATCLAYIWVIYLGVYCKTYGLQAVIHRAGRCDLSLFQLGFRLLSYLLKEDLPIPWGIKKLDEYKI